MDPLLKEWLVYEFELWIPAFGACREALVILLISLRIPLVRLPTLCEKPRTYGLKEFGEIASNAKHIGRPTPAAWYKCNGKVRAHELLFWTNKALRAQEDS